MERGSVAQVMQILQIILEESSSPRRSPRQVRGVSSHAYSIQQMWDVYLCIGIGRVV